ncbi:DUF6538 domain-containing protein [Xanthobacter oligotrophicus]|uniref:DUF6538 domain-containing protein n=2 Tax=Xanthobacter oligotrophicus TaxID=2607286 RepID=UPI0011F201BA|nr:DUF6538 domain-containing protein [Xanthobacter oligotrophicus]
MALRMPRPVRRPDTSFLSFRARVPADIVDAVKGLTIALAFPAEAGEPEHVALVRPGREVKFSLRTRNPAVAKSRHGIALAQLETRWNAIRSGPRPLSHRQIIALSGEVYRLFVERFEENPGPPEMWAAVKAFNRAAREGRISTAPRLSAEEVDSSVAAAEPWHPDLTGSVNSLPRDTTNRLEAMESRFGWLADWVLATHGVVTDGLSRVRLLDAVEQAATDAAWRLKRAAAGDYSPDPAAQRFPAFALASVAPPPRATSRRKADVSLSALVEAWGRERQPRAKTLYEHQRVVRAFEKHLAHDDAAAVTPEDVVAWKDALVATGKLAPKTINAKYLTPLNTVLNWAKANRRIPTNPAQGIRSAGKALPRARDRSFTAEATTILKAALVAFASPGRNTRETLAARRWVPWICAYSGARVGEVAQLRGQDFQEVQGVWVFRISPEAGAVKTDKPRTVPLHPDLIRQGILEFVRERGEGPLFYRETRARRGGKAQAHPSKTVAGRLAGWVRLVGVKDPNVQPNHGWRHLFMTLCRAHGVGEEARYFVVGHTKRDTGQHYGEASVVALHREISKLPAFKVD